MKSWKFSFSPDCKTLTYGAYNLNTINYIDKKILSKTGNDGSYNYSSEYIDDSKVAVGKINGSIYFYNIEEGEIKKVNKIEEHSKAVRSLLYDKTNNKLISASDDMHINIIDLEKNKVVFPVVGHKDVITSLDKIIEKNILISGSLDGKIKLWDMRTSKEVETYISGGSVWDLSVSNDEKIILTGTESGCEFLMIK